LQSRRRQIEVLKGTRNPQRAVSAPVALTLLLTVLFSPSAAQPAANTAPLVIQTVSLPKAYLRQPFLAQLEARGGVPPFRWEVSEGLLPPGISLDSDGELEGTPTEAGEFFFTVKAIDSNKPAQEITRQLSLSVTSPLWARWGRYPKINGQRLEGSIWVSNQTDRDFDLTMIVLAVNEIGRATAIGYQHFPLKKNSDEVELPFGDNLSRGSYQLNVDVVAEVAATDSIYRVRLVPKERFQMEQGP
jgi:Putative Ig domain